MYMRRYVFRVCLLSFYLVQRLLLFLVDKWHFVWWKPHRMCIEKWFCTVFGDGGFDEYLYSYICVCVCMLLLVVGMRFYTFRLGVYVTSERLSQINDIVFCSSFCRFKRSVSTSHQIIPFGLCVFFNDQQYFYRIVCSHFHRVVSISILCCFFFHSLILRSWWFCLYLFSVSQSLGVVSRFFIPLFQSWTFRHEIFFLCSENYQRISNRN